MSSSVDGPAQTTRTTFSRTTSVSIMIDADRATVWRLLTNAEAYPKWNSTIVSLEGQISLGSKIRLVSTLDPTRTFNLKIKELEAPARLVWGDALGRRVFTLSETTPGHTRFEMSERIGGPVFPLFAGKIPSFDASFNRFAADLKEAAENRS